MDEFYKQLIDRMEGYELVELLDISAEDIVSAFPELIERYHDELTDFLNHGR